MVSVNDDPDEEGTLDYGGVLPIPSDSSAGPAPGSPAPAGPSNPYAHAGPHSHPPQRPSSGYGPPSGLSHSLDEEPPTIARPNPWAVPTHDQQTRLRQPPGGALARSGYDTQLARFLGKIGRLNLPTLQAALIHARSQRGAGVTLAQALVSHGHLSHEEAAAFLRHVSTTVLEDSGEYEAQTIARAPGGSSIVYGDGWSLGEEVGNYRLTEKLGVGGMGVVYKAQDLRTGQAVAIKTLTPVEDPEFLARFQREGQAQSRLDHPNLVRVHAWGERNDRPYLVMDFVEGRDLQQALRQGPIEAREAARIVRDVASAVAHMHQTGVLHRDLKPSNILIDQQGRPRLVDFGVARLEGAQTLTRTGDVLGTPAFMSPEQALGEREHIGPKSDVYSLCAVLYNLLTASPPFRGASAVTLLTQVVQDVPPPPREIVEDGPDDLEAICLRGLSKDPQERPTAAGLVEVLDRFLSGERLDAKDRPPPKARGGMILAFFLFVGGVSLGLWGRQPGPESTPSPTPAASAVATAPSASPSPTPSEPVLSAPGLRFSSKVQTFELEVSTDVAFSRFGNDQSTLDMKNILTMAWRARKLESGSWSIDAEIEALVFDWGLVRNGSSEAVPPMHYDSRRAKTGAFSVALGRRFSFDLDPKTGDVDNLYGVAAIQSAVFEAAGPDAWRHRAPVFQPAALESLLESLFRGPTLQLTPGEWKLTKEPPPIIGGERRGQGERDESGLKHNRAPPVELTYVRRRGTLNDVQWSGRGTNKIAPYPFTLRPKGKPPEEVMVESGAKREVVGRAFFEEDGVLSSLELNETVKILRVFKAGGRELQAPSESKSLVRLRKRD